MTAEVDNRFAEVPSPPQLNLIDRGPWLSKIMAGTWQELPPELQQWRRDLIEAAMEFAEDSIVFSHFVAINVLVGAARSDDRLISFRPDNASVTTLSNSDGDLSLIGLGAESETRVN